MVGLIDKAEEVTRSFLSREGESIILLGGLPHELGASYYLQTQFGKKEGRVPEIDLESEKKVQEFLLSQISNGFVQAAHDLSEGGLLVALAEMLFEKNELGMSVSIDSLGNSGRLDALLFGESQGRVLVSVSEEGEFISAAEQAGVPAQVIGCSDLSGRLKVSVAGNEILDSSVSGLCEAWGQAIPEIMGQG
jgi:phosphoribosylformylglycinamidine synthase